jgi:hypothetical protein
VDIPERAQAPNDPSARVGGERSPYAFALSPQSVENRVPCSPGRCRAPHGSPHSDDQLGRRARGFSDEIALRREGARRVPERPQSAARDHHDTPAMAARIERGDDVGRRQT